MRLFRVPAVIGLAVIGLTWMVVTGAAAQHTPMGDRMMSIWPDANTRGWRNDKIFVRFLCRPDTPCPEPITIETEGRGQVVKPSTADGRAVGEPIVVNLDRTPPAIQIQTPAGGMRTTEAEVAIVAHVSDTLSGPADATCNGRPAPVAAAGIIRCRVPLAPGLNDIIVQASDQADNSASAGIRVTRTVDRGAIRILPETFSILLGRPRPLQVVDDADMPVSDVVWRVDNPSLAEMAQAQDGSHVITPKAIGVVTLTATRGDASAQAKVTIFDGRAYPAGAIWWKVGNLSILQTPDTPPRRDEQTPERPLVDMQKARDGHPIVRGIDERIGYMVWTIVPAIGPDELANHVRPHVNGGAIIVVRSKSGKRSAIVSTGPLPDVAPWRYQSSGHVQPGVIEDVKGRITFVETPASGYPQLVTVEGRDGHVLWREYLPRGRQIVHGANCVEGASSWRELPAEVGPLSVGPKEALTFAMLNTDSLEDFSVCGEVSGKTRQTLRAAIITADGPRVETVLSDEVPAGTLLPKIQLFPIGSDGQDGHLVPWTMSPGGGEPLESRVTHITPGGRQEYVMPVAGPIKRVKDVGAMTDGKTLIGFRLMTGDVLWTRVFPGGVRILPGEGQKDQLIVVHRTQEILDEFGRAVPQP
jgi:hypothetical protein